jgi:hypothetical protein
MCYQFVGWSSFAFKGFCSLCDNIYERVCCYNRCHGYLLLRGFGSIGQCYNSYDDNAVK